MLSFRRWMSGLLIGSGMPLCAAPPLTTIQDVLYKADGTPFSGVATISWHGFDASDSSNIAAQEIHLNVANGNLRVRLVPTTNAGVPAAYSVKYNSGGKNQFTETWAVPPSSTPLRVKDVRVAAASTVTPPVQLQMQISDITGLQNALNIRPVEGTGFASSATAVINSAGAIDGAIGNPADCVHVDGSSGSCGTTVVSGSTVVFVDEEVPAGNVDGSNTIFALSQTPNPSTSAALYRNGIRLKSTVDFTISGNSIRFGTGLAPQPGDVLQCSYRVSN